MWPKITKNYSPNFSIPKRSKQKIKFIIIHYTGMKNESLAIKRLCDSNSKVSAHYFIKRNGNILNLVPNLYTAWHSGISRWKNYTSLNKNSIGIEIQNFGHNFKYQNFTTPQINTLEKLLKKLKTEFKIDKKNVLGHSDIAPERKIDPGEKFPWKKLSKLGLVSWHSLNEKKLKELRLKKINTLDKKKFFKIISKIGYKKTKKVKSNNKDIVKSFQRKFRQSLINGIIDKECFIISKNLLK